MSAWHYAGAMGPKHMTPDEFRRHGYAVVDWVARYMEQVERYPVKTSVAPGAIMDALPKAPPEHGEPFEALLADLDEVLMPGITHWQSPNFFAYFPANTSGASILGDLLCSGLAVQGMLWETSPACTELETSVLDWTAKLLGLPERFLSTSAGGGVIQDSASSATLCAVLAARERTLAGEGNRLGLADAGGGLVAYASSQAHSSVEKALRIAGIGSAQLRLVDVDARHSIDPEALATQMRRDADAGLRPFFMSATLGSTASGAFDSLPAVVGPCKLHDVWLHADAAMFGAAACCPEYRWLHQGVEQADSYCFNPHKWMLTGFDCDCFWVADRQALIGALSIMPTYLDNAATASGEVIDYRDWQVPLGRRFRSLKLWAVLRYYGVAGLQALIREHVALAQELATWIDADERFEIAAPHPLNLVCFRHRAGDAANESIMEEVNGSGALYITHCELDGRFTLRLCVGQAQTNRGHVERAWHAIAAAAP